MFWRGILRKRNPRLPTHAISRCEGDFIQQRKSGRQQINNAFASSADISSAQAARTRVQLSAAEDYHGVTRIPVVAGESQPGEGPTTKGPGPGGSERPDGFRIGESEGTAFGYTVDGEDEGQCGIGPERDGANG